jgi:hypothetical protein
MAQEGEQFKHTAALRFVEEIDFFDNTAQGAELQVHVATPDDLILDENTDDFVIANWLRNVTEVYLRYSELVNGEEGIPVLQTTMYRVSEHGFHEYKPIGESDYELELEFQVLIEQANNSLFDFMEIEQTINFYEKIGAMKLYPFE